METLTLENLGKGAAEEEFQEALKVVLANIRDPNTDWKLKRAIVMTVTFLPEESRSESKFAVTFSKKLAPMKPFASTILFGMVEGELVAKEVHQDHLFPPQEITSKHVYTLKKEDKHD